MKSLIGETRSTASNASIGIIKPEYQRGYQIASLPHQKYGILTRILWTTKTQMLRIVPGHDPQTGEIYPQNIMRDRFSKEDDRAKYLSDTFINVSMIEKFGSAGPIISSYPEGSKEATMWGGETVLRRFVRNIMYACSEKRGKRDLVPINEWKLWTAYGNQSKLSYDSPALLMQALIFHINGRNNQNPDTKSDLIDSNGNIMPLLAVCALTNGESISRLYDALVMPKDFALPLDAATNNQFGALAELQGNMLYLNPTKVNKNGKMQNVLDPSVQPAGEAGWNPSPFEISEDAARDLWVPWEQLLNPLTMEEQLQLCAQEFGADTVNYVIGTDKILQGIEIPDNIRSAGLGKYTNLVGGSVTLTSGVPNVVQASAGKTIPAFNGLGLPSPVTGAPVQQPRPQVQAAPAVGVARTGITPLRQPAKTTGIQNTGTVDVNEVLRKTAAIRAAAGMNKTDGQAETAAGLVGSLPSEEDN